MVNYFALVEDTKSSLFASVVVIEPLSVSLTILILTNLLRLAVIVVNNELTMHNILDVSCEFRLAALLVIMKDLSFNKLVYELLRQTEGEVRPVCSPMIHIRGLRITEDHRMTMIDAQRVIYKNLALLGEFKGENGSSSRVKWHC